jgi:hypothetical protein
VKKFSPFVIFIAISLAGCVTPPPLQKALQTPSQNQKYGIAKSEIVSKSDRMTQHLNTEQSILYFQNQGGGGAGLGILLGPLGVAANIKMIEGVTTSDVEKIKGKIELNPEAAFLKASSLENFSIHEKAELNDVKVAPYILISKTNEKTLHMSSVVLFEGVEGSNKWTKRYQYQLPGKYTLDELAKLSSSKAAELQEASVNGYVSILKYIAEEKVSEIEKEQKIIFNSPYMSPRFELSMRGSLIGAKDGRTWVRTVIGVAAIDPSDIKYEIIKN